ncbi:heavy metal translocating P-type ATPase [Dorea sp. AM13-35]|uniref:heavy metal translocating P-type ATPase n=1 Tax=Dorea sp. AM13-35 TaxID=2293099 RepID=UPI000E55506C|nr:heavy metal translocating P-type ATPase [Dorea sp. AM13-35]RHO37734.1 cadmium-translocating P-type ATPase [Dorea sp. AM13-35]
MTEQLKKQSMIYGVGVVIYLAAVIVTSNFTIEDEIKFVWFLIAYLIVGFDVFKKLRDRILELKFLTEYTLTTVATIGAFGIGRYTEGVLVMILFELGVIFEAYSTDNAKRSIEEMIDIRPAFAIRKTDGGEEQIDPIDLQVGDIIVIKPGERVPVDGIVEAGSTLLDMKAVTGESMPRRVSEGNKIYSGCINLSGAVEAKVLKVYRDSTVAQIMELVEEAQNKESESESFVSRFSRIYTPAMVLLALFVMIYPPLTFSYHNWNIWIYRGLIFLIVACPTALVMSIPIAFLGGIASAARQGIVIKGANYLEDLSKADTFVFDKTGTLTEGEFSVQEIYAEQGTEEELLKIAAHVESYSNHPIAQSLLNAYDGEIDKDLVSNIKQIPGYGLSGDYDGKRIHVGNFRLMEKYDIEVDEFDSTGTVVYVSVGTEYRGAIIIEDAIKYRAKWTMKYLKDKCKAVLVMLTGDTRSAGYAVAKELKMDYAYTDLMPSDKLEQLEDFLTIQDDMEKLVCVGDGVNDAPVLARADIGIAMGALGSALAIEAADIILLEDELPKIVDAIKISKETLRVVNQNIAFAIAVKVIIVLLALVGYFGMWEAIVAEVGVVFAAIMNAVYVVKYYA